MDRYDLVCQVLVRLDEYFKVTRDNPSRRSLDDFIDFVRRLY